MRVITLNDDEALINYAQPIVAELRANTDAGEFAALAAKRWFYYTREGAAVASLDEMRAANAQMRPDDVTAPDQQQTDAHESDWHRRAIDCHGPARATDVAAIAPSTPCLLQWGLMCNQFDRGEKGFGSNGDTNAPKQMDSVAESPSL